MADKKKVARALAARRIASQNELDQYDQSNVDLSGQYKEAPLTEAQKGEMAGISAHNAAVPALNQLLKTGKKALNESEYQDFLKLSSEGKKKFLKEKGIK